MTRARSTIRAPPAWAAARWTRIPDCFAPRGHPNGQLPQSPQPGVLRRVGAASQPRIPAPRRITWSLAGITVERLTPSSVSISETSDSNSAPSIPSIACRRVQSVRTSAGAGMLVIQLTNVPPPTAVPDSIVIDPSHVVSSP